VRRAQLRITKVHAQLLDCGGTGLHPLAAAKYERALTMALLVQETALAWTLAEAVKPHLSAIERSDVFIAIGAGETFAAIRGLVTSVAAKRIALRPDLAQQCVAWLHAYVGHKDERYFRRLIDGVSGSMFEPGSGNGTGQPCADHANTRSAGCVCAQRHRLGSTTDVSIGTRRRSW
jgi:hypothetical protein